MRAGLRGAAVLAVCAGGIRAAPPRAPRDAERVELRVVTDEPDAILAILGKKSAGRTVAAADWKRLFESEGFVRLRKREAMFHAPIDEEAFRQFVLSESLLARREALTQTLARWRGANLRGSASLALAYLPADARIHATVYPVIKPRENSFVFEVPENPAVFVFLDPAVSRAKLENTVAHELHHIGYGTACPDRKARDEIGRLPTSTRTALTWVGAFGEGFAMLAASGGPRVHPHAVSVARVRERWDRDMANFPRDLAELEAFFQDVLAERLSSDQAEEKAMTFFGEQGPWYTVGWKMAATIEEAEGRPALIAAMCDPRSTLAAYDRAAARLDPALPRWSPPLVEALEGRSSRVP